MTSPISRRRLLVPIAVAAALATGLFGAYAGTAQTPSVSPAATPAASTPLPNGPLGEQIQWLLDTANAGAGAITDEDIEAHFAPAFLEQVSIDDVVAVLSDLQSAGVTYEIEPNSLVTTRDLPATNGRFVLVGSDGSRTEVSVQIERDAGLIAGLLFAPASDATPIASPAA